MKIGIHHRNGSYSDGWIAYCEENNIPYKTVNAYNSNIVKDLADCDIFMWQHHHGNPKDVLFAKQLLYSLEQAGKIVYPDWKTNWHFDDKLGQKYLLEAIGAPLVPSYVFYEKGEALDWIKETTFPKVFKLRGGAGSANVRLVKTKSEARRLVRKAFHRGFKQFNAWSGFKEILRKRNNGSATLFDILKGLARIVYPPAFSKVMGRDRGYIYFQEFLPNNDHDIRVIIIDQRAFAIKRMVRKNDFRASGSGHILYEKELFDDKTITLAFNIADKLNGQCVAFDFIFEADDHKLVEISYGFDPGGYDACPGYWDKELNWHEGPFDPYGWMIEVVRKNG